MSIFERQPTIRWGFQSPKYKFRFAQQRDDKGDFIRRWNDELLGDPEFFAKEVKPLLNRLDKAGETLDESAASSLAEIRYGISERRAKYLKKKLMEKE